MKKQSIKVKIILWYTTLVACLMGLALAMLFTVAGQTAASTAKSTLSHVTVQMADEVDFDDGKVDIDHDFKPYDKGVLVLAIYQNAVVAGQYPAEFPMDTPLQPGAAFPVESGGEKWLVQDISVDTGLFVRGIRPVGEDAGALSGTLVLALIAFPLFVLLAAAGGWFITKKAFAPVAKIARTAGEIGSGRDLSKRIAAADTGDEIAALARTFDQMLDRLERAFEDEKQFTSDVSHELRTPLAVLKAQCEYALSQPENEAAPLGEMLEKINQMTVLVAQLLEISRAEHQTAALEFAPVDVSELLELVTEELTHLAEEKSICLTANSGGAIVLHCEQTLMMRLMMNLLENAIKYTPSGGTVTATLSQTPGQVLFSVADTGIGIPPEHLEKLFNRFYKVSTSRTWDDQGGFGLGLSFCQWIVRAHHGEITVESTPGSGSTFRVTLPA